MTSGKGDRCNQLWKFDVITKKWSLESDERKDNKNSESKYSNEILDIYPVGRSGHGMEYIPHEKTIIIFGGRKSKSADGDLNDLWEFDLEQK